MPTRSPGLFRPLALVLALILLLPPEAARAQFGSMTVGDEKELGRKFDETIRAQLNFVDDPEVLAYVKGVVDRVAASLPPQPWPRSCASTTAASPTCARPCKTLWPARAT